MHAYYLHYRPNNRSLLFYGGRLFQEWCVDAAATYEQNNLRWVKANLKKLRSDLYRGLADTIADHYVLDANTLGKRVILPSTFAGSPRQMGELYNNAMSLVRYFGKPDLFIMVTCNPTWPEIRDNLLPNQQASDHPDIVVRAFQLRLKSIMNDLIKVGILRRVVAYINVIEFQKRRLPNAYILLILKEDQRIRSTQKVDIPISTELSDKINQPSSWSTRTSCMMHGLCVMEFQVHHV